MRKFLLTTATLLALAAPAAAQIINPLETLGGTRDSWITGGAASLSIDPTTDPNNQPRNAPCLICGTNQPGQPTGFGYNDFSAQGNDSEYRMFSTALTGANGTGGATLGQDVLGLGYEAGFLATYLLSQTNTLDFAVGLDINQTNANSPQTLEAFALFNVTQGTLLAQLSLFDAGGILVPEIHNGTGFPDYLISGFDIGLGDIAFGDRLLFYARWSDANDGAESFYLVAVPGPTIGAGLPGLLALLGAGGLWGLIRRRKPVMAAA